MPAIRAYAARSRTSELAPFPIERRTPRPDDVAIRIDFCGICHTDLHFAHDDWGMTVYPVVPGHEIVGTVTAVGSAVTRFRAGDRVGVGCLVDSCRDCPSCERGLEQYCEKGMVMTYGSRDRHDGSITCGGYSESILASERFVLRMPQSLDPAASAPLLCAGITTWSPLRRFGVRAGHRVGIVGMGGLGHMGVKFARALGAEVTVFTRSPGKAREAERQGAHRVVVSTDAGQMKSEAGRYDLVLDTVPTQHDLNPYVGTLATDGTLVLVGLLEPVVPPLNAGALVFRRRAVVGSLIGGLPETQEMLDFCGEHRIGCDIERIPIQRVNEAFARVARGDVRYRFVIEMESLRQEGAAGPGSS